MVIKRKIYNKFLMSFLRFLIIVLFILAGRETCQAQAEQIVVNLFEGSDPGRVGIDHGDLRIYDILPYFKVDQEGNVIVADIVNSRIQIFGRDGNLLGIIQPSDPEDAIGFPIEFLPMPGRKIVTLTNSNRLIVYDYNNNSLASKDGVIGTLIATLSDGRFVLKRLRYGDFIIYDSNLNILKTLIEKPPELGTEKIYNYPEVVEHYIKYPDGQCYVFLNKGVVLFDIQRRDDNLILMSEKEIWIIAPDSRISESAKLPENIYGPEPTFDDAESAFDTEPALIMEYSAPILGMDGNIYTMRRFSAFLQILKWNLLELPPASKAIVEVENNPPVLDPIGSREIVAGNELVIELIATDPDKDRLTFSVENLPPGASFDSKSHIFTWRPTSEQVGQYQVLFKVEDTQCAADEEEVIINVVSE